MKVSELSGARLALLVARHDPRCDGITWRKEGDNWIGYGTLGTCPQEFPCLVITDLPVLKRMKLVRDLRAEFYNPHEDWAQGGPILAQVMATGNWQIEPWNDVHRISPGSTVAMSNYKDDGDYYMDEVPIGGHKMPHTDFLAPDVLTAVCRAFVFHHYGAEVPDEVAA